MQEQAGFKEVVCGRAVLNACARALYSDEGQQAALSGSCADRMSELHRIICAGPELHACLFALQVLQHLGDAEEREEP